MIALTLAERDDVKKAVVVFEERAYLANVDEEEYKILKKAVDQKDLDWIDTFLLNRKPLETPHQMEELSWLLVVELT